MSSTSERTMTVKYDEGLAAQVVNSVDGPKRVERGEAVVVTEEVGKRLLAQGWKRTTAKPKKADKKTSTDESSSED